MNSLHIFLGLIALSATTAALAETFRCTSVETHEGAPAVMFKLNPKQKFTTAGESFERYVLGVTPTGSDRFAAYGTGTSDENSFGINIVSDGTLLGYARAHNRGEEGVLTGEFKHTKISHRTYEIRCVNLTPKDPPSP